jgi:hypothetical protein
MNPRGTPSAKSTKMAADSPQLRPCECDACSSIRASYPSRRLDAETRSRILLRKWLSSEQLAQYETRGAFEVIGSKTGRRYRIEERRQLNVYQLDRRGRRSRGWCFIPKGGLPTGDVMLAQKVALETDEERVMKVALPFRTETGLDWLVSWVAAIWGRGSVNRRR